MTDPRPRIQLKRAYADPAPEDGTRVLVERLWPRGLSKERAHIEVWLREIAPSTELRRWYGHDPARWPEFRARYLAELRDDPQATALHQLRAIVREGPTTLVFAARDEAHSSAIIVWQVLNEA